MKETIKVIRQNFERDFANRLQRDGIDLGKAVKIIKCVDEALNEMERNLALLWPAKAPNPLSYVPEPTPAKRVGGNPKGSTDLFKLKRPSREVLEAACREMDWVYTRIAARFQVIVPTVKAWIDHYELQRPASPLEVKEDVHESETRPVLEEGQAPENQSSD